MVGVCTHQNCVKKAQLSGIDAKFTLYRSREDHGIGSNQHADKRQLICLYCGCNTVMAWTPTAVTSHFVGNHADFICKFSDDRRAALAASHVAEDLNLLKKKYGVLERHAQEAIDAVNAKNLVLKNDECDLQKRNDELENACKELQHHFIDSVTSLADDDQLVQYISQLSAKIRQELCDVASTSHIQHSGTFAEEILGQYDNRAFIDAARNGHASIKILIDLLRDIMASKSDQESTDGLNAAHADLIISLLLGHLLSMNDHHYSYPLGTLLSLRVRLLSSSTLCVDLLSHVYAGVSNQAIVDNVGALAEMAERTGIKIEKLTGKIAVWDNLGTS